MPRRDQSPDIDEQSPLIAAQNTDQNGDVTETSLTEPLGVEDSVVESKSTLYLFLLTICIGGLQIVWSVELSNGSPYLLSLGMSKALMAIIWLAGPLTGVLVQPVVGVLSDRSRISWGKRRPFMIAGSLGVVATSLLLSYAKEIVWILGPWSNEQRYEGAWKGITIGFAAVMMWCLDFFINAVQATIRAFIVDCAPAHQQEAANGWASRLVGVGNVTGYIFGYLDLPKYFRFFGNTQFKVLCVIASILLCSTVFLSSATIQERNPNDDAPTKENQSSGVVGFFKQVYDSATRLSPQVRSVCRIQFVHWLGWFPFLFYTTTYIGQLYVDPRLRPGMTDEEIDELWTVATRVGTLALLAYACVSFTANLILPFLVVPSYKRPMTAVSKEEVAQPITPTSPIDGRSNSVTYSEDAYERTASQSSLQHGYATEFGPDHTGAKSPSFIQRFLKRLQIPGLNIRRMWMIAQILHGVAAQCTFFIRSTLAGTIMVAFVGISWALTLWAPFALISADIARRTEHLRKLKGPKLLNSDGTAAAEEEGDSMKPGEEEHRAGIILGLHNVAISAPQVLATLISSLLFKLLQKDRGTPGDTSVAWTLRLGGLAALCAAFLTWRMKDASEENEEK